MKIKKESDFSAESVRALRESLGMSQRVFWGAVCVSIARGCAYEIGRNEIPATVKRLLWLHYCVGIPTDTAMPTSNQDARKALEMAKTKIDAALSTLPDHSKVK